MTKPNPRGKVSATKEQTLYRFWNDNTLLYVGISQSFLSRMDQHESVKTWWPQVTHITVQHYPNRVTVEAAEKTAIKVEKPLHNLVHSDDWENYDRHISNILNFGVTKTKKWAGKHEWIYKYLQKADLLQKTSTINVQAQEIKVARAWLVMNAYELAKFDGFSCRACDFMLEADGATKLRKRGDTLLSRKNIR